MKKDTMLELWHVVCGGFEMTPWWWSCWKLMFPPSGWCIWYMDTCHTWSSQGLRPVGWARWTAWVVIAATYSCAPQGREGGGAPAAFCWSVGRRFGVPWTSCGVEDWTGGVRQWRVVWDNDGWCVTMTGGVSQWQVVCHNEGWCLTMKGVLLVLWLDGWCVTMTGSVWQWRVVCDNDR